MESTIANLLIGKTVLYMTDALVEVELVIEKIDRDSTSREITPDTPANDWWGESVTTYFYMVTFDSGFKKRYESLEDIRFQKD